jgi:hypothetical protein
VPARDRRTVGELPAESDAVSRETLLEVLTSQGPATARTWGQVVQSAPRLWAVPLPISLAPTAGPGLLVRLRVVGEGIARNTSAGDWPALIPLPEPARRGLGNLTNVVIAACNRAVAAAAPLDPCEPAQLKRSGPSRALCRSGQSRKMPQKEPAPRGRRR